jgi:DNA helicase-2/ATP-dependent DNA helicase PcrA
MTPSLNPAQLEAVEHVHGPLLVLAGAGSGKTRVLTTRIAVLIDRHGVPPERIFAVTFTNKAAGEMKERVAKLLDRDPSGLWIGTFHSLSARLLRREAELLGFTRQFTIYDEDDRLSLIKRLMDQRGHPTKLFAPRAVQSLISTAKNRMQTPAELPSASPFDRLAQVAADVYGAMGPALKTANAMDFDDLMLHPLTLFHQHPERLRAYQERFNFVLVDEFQDTNRAQYELIRLLGAHGNVCAVGDDDQCLIEGTGVTMADRTVKPIENVRPDDIVLSNYGSGDFRPARVLRVHRHSTPRPGIAITMRSGRRLVSTPEHTHFAGYRLGLVPQTHFVYLMQREAVGFRIGTTQVYTRGQRKPMVGLEQRLLQEHGDALWVVSTHESENEARAEEYILSLRYQLPMLPFVPRKCGLRGESRGAAGLSHDGRYLERVFAAFDTENGARRLLADRGLPFDHPYHRPRSRDSKRRNLVITLCGDRRGATPMHRIAMVGNDEAGRRVLESIGLSVRPAKAGSRSWRFESARASYPELWQIVDKVRVAFAGYGNVLHIAQTARLGNNGFEGEIGTNSLRFLPAAAVMPGMVMFDESGGYDVVASVDHVSLDRPVYDLDIEGTHNFVANGLVTHNSIYGWRGADVRNMQEFLKDFPGAKLVRLEENYRSSQVVLDAANGVIAENTGRIGKTLVTRRKGGEPVTVLAAADERDEAEWVVRELKQRSEAGDWHATEMAVLYRTNAQSRALEEAFRRAGMPYRLIGAISFYERREVKDLLAYLRLVANPSDDEAFLRAVGVPKRGLGDTSVGVLATAAHGWGKPLLETASMADRITDLRPGVREAFRGFARFIYGLVEHARALPPAQILEQVIRGTEFEAYLQAEGPEGVERWENVRELVASAADWSEEVVLDGEFETQLERFLTEATLLSAQDKIKGDEGGVTLMTLHTAKGLEWPVVVITGLEHGLFPLARAEEQPNGLEEERRLCYVGLTRAKDKLYLSWARARRRGGELRPGIPSRFLRDLPPAVIDERRTTSLWAPEWGGRSGAGSRSGTAGGGGSRYGGRAAESGVRAKAPAAPPAPAEEEASQDAPRYVKGERVRHRRFGGGTIRGLSGTGRDLKVLVAFDDELVGEKQLLVAYAGLEREWESA